MPQYLVIAKDHTDDQALNRRLDTREKHLEMAKKLKESGNFVKAAAFLNADGKMCGSAMMMEFESKETLDNWLKEEPYILGNVWDTVEVTEVKIAPL
jgi:uncharacterized protein YciI